MNMQVKICGLTNLDDALAATRLGADFVGLILAKSARRVSRETARQIMEKLPPATKPVLLFRDAPPDEIDAALPMSRAAYVQLHGQESPEYVRQLCARRPQIRIIKAWEISSGNLEAELSKLSGYLEQTARLGARIEKIFLDLPKGGPDPGPDVFAAIARTWPTMNATRPELWRAGGLTLENLPAVLQTGGFAGVDVARGVETRPGVKDHEAMRRFIEIAKQARGNMGMQERGNERMEEQAP